jgi:hypothetical protein
LLFNIFNDNIPQQICDLTPLKVLDLPHISPWVQQKQSSLSDAEADG